MNGEINHSIVDWVSMYRWCLYVFRCYNSGKIDIFYKTQTIQLSKLPSCAIHYPPYFMRDSTCSSYIQNCGGQFNIRWSVSVLFVVSCDGSNHGQQWQNKTVHVAERMPSLATSWTSSTRTIGNEPQWSRIRGHCIYTHKAWSWEPLCCLFRL